MGRLSHTGWQSLFHSHLQAVEIMTGVWKKGGEGGEGGERNVVFTPHMQSTIQHMQYTCNGG